MKWDANNYKNNFSFVHQYGKGVAELIDYKEGMSILDLGCGNGNLSKQFYDEGYHVIGLDSSKDMLAIAKENYPEIEFIEGDATNFKLDEKVDVIFSNAVFHWIHKQDDLLECISNNLKENGQLVVEFGGKDNCEKIHSALEKQFNLRKIKYPRTFYFPSIGEYTSLMEKHHLLATYAILFERKTLLNGDDGLENWIRMFIVEPFNGIDEDLKNEIIKDAVEFLKDELYEDGKWYADYIRIRIKAKRI